MKTRIKQKLLHTKQRSGHTLVETLVAISLLAMGIAGSSKVVVMTRELSSMATDETVCLQLANNRLECIHNVDFSDVMMWSKSNLVVNSKGLPSPTGRYQISTFVNYPDVTATNYAEVKVNISIRNRETLQFDRPPKEYATIATNL